jgi:hypothetical protein
MAKAPATATLLLPASDACLQSLPATSSRALARADLLAGAAPNRTAQLRRHFALVPNGWPVAALTRQIDVGDAAGSMWLRADPAWVRPDINGARMLACGDSLYPAQQDVDALLPALRPLFGDAGFALDAPTPARWYLRLPTGSPMPAFAEPDDVLGADLFEHLPESGQVDDATVRRWRVLMSDVQVVLHNHPWNARRAAAGKPPINSLWFWGGGALPDAVVSPVGLAWSDDSLMRALGVAARMDLSALPERFVDPESDVLVDLRNSAADDIQARWLAPAIDAMRRRALAGIELDCMNGTCFRLSPAQRWRFWRKPRPFSRHTVQRP